VRERERERERERFSDGFPRLISFGGTKKRGSKRGNPQYALDLFSQAQTPKTLFTYFRTYLNSLCLFCILANKFHFSRLQKNHHNTPPKKNLRCGMGRALVTVIPRQQFKNFEAKALAMRSVREVRLRTSSLWTHLARDDQRNRAVH